MIGWIMLAVPFVAIFVYAAKIVGIKDALKIYLITFALASWVFLGSYLMRSA